MTTKRKTKSKTTQNSVFEIANTEDGYYNVFFYYGKSKFNPEKPNNVDPDHEWYDHTYEEAIDLVKQLKSADVYVTKTQTVKLDI